MISLAGYLLSAKLFRTQLPEVRRTAVRRCAIARDESGILPAVRNRRANHSLLAKNVRRFISMEKASLRIRDGKIADRNSARPAGRRILWGLITLCSLSILPQVCPDIPWPEVVQRLKQENEKLARRPQGHEGEYFVVCTLYYTPMESGFTAERGFDVTLETKPGLHGRKYPREFLQAVKMEGYGRIIAPVNGDRYIRHTGGDSFVFAAKPAGHGGELRPRFSAAAHREQPVFGLHV